MLANARKDHSSPLIWALKCVREKDLTRDWNVQNLYGKPLARDWVARVVFLIQILLIFGCRCNRFFRDIRLKIYRLPNFNMLFQCLITKFPKANCFRVYRKLITWLTIAKGVLCPVTNTSVQRVQGKRKYVSWSSTSWTPFSCLSCEQSNQRWALYACSSHFN